MNNLADIIRKQWFCYRGLGEVAAGAKTKVHSEV